MYALKRINCSSIQRSFGQKSFSTASGRNPVKETLANVVRDVNKKFAPLEDFSFDVTKNKEVLDAFGVPKDKQTELLQTAEKAAQARVNEVQGVHEEK